MQVLALFLESVKCSLNLVFNKYVVFSRYIGTQNSLEIQILHKFDYISPTSSKENENSKIF